VPYVVGRSQAGLERDVAQRRAAGQPPALIHNPRELRGSEQVMAIHTSWKLNAAETGPST
jgi:hypothetical protein